MHRCLMILDVLLQLFDLPILEKKDLACLARTCKAFSSSALDVLWREQDDIAHASKCMGWNVWEERVATDRREERAPQLYLTGSIMTEHWSRFHVYADRIKAFCMQSGTVGLDPQSMSILLACAPLSPLFCNVRKLVCESDIYDHMLPCLRLFFGPTLSILEFNSQREESLTGQSMLPILPSQCPNVKVFKVNGPLTSAMADNIAMYWQKLETLHLRSGSGKNVLAMSFLPGLHTFVVTMLNDNISAILSAPPDALRFPALQSFQLDAWSLLSVDGIVRSGTWRRLRRIDVLSPPEPAAVWGAFTETLKIHLSPDIMDTIVIQEKRFDCAPADNDPQRVLTLSTLRPLLSFPNLTCFDAHFQYGFDLDDVALHELASAWPMLRSFHLSAVGGWRMPSKITLYGLVQLLRACPDLETLGIVISATNANVCLPSTYSGVSNRKITAMSLGNSVIDDAEPVVAVMSEILPCLRSISSWGPRTRVQLHLRRGSFEDLRHDLYERRWAEVARLIPREATRRTHAQLSPRPGLENAS